jgi:hydrogenase maturation protein HypF
MKLAESIAENVARYSEETGVKVAALSGGVFQNTLFLEYVKKLLSRKNIRVLTHGIIPPNDGGVSAGQALAGLYTLNKNK